MNEKLLTFAQRIQALAHTGLHYGTGVYDLERYAELNQISLEMMSLLLDQPVEILQGLFSIEPAYATPKVDIRAFVLKAGKVLMVKEVSDGKWSLPGGWADVGLSPMEVAQKEVKEETGLEVRPTRLLAVFDKKFHPHPAYMEYTYKLCILCEVLGGRLQGSIETTQVGFFDPHNLPELSEERITHNQIEILLKRTKNPQENVWLD
ncbi:MAG: NUDIX hydrolase [Bacteroidota bacterium]